MLPYPKTTLFISIGNNIIQWLIISKYLSPPCGNLFFPFHCSTVPIVENLASYFYIILIFFFPQVQLIAVIGNGA